MDGSKDDFDCESYPIVDFDSDDERRNDSSGDEADVILHGTPQQKRRLCRRSLGHESSSEDEFEKEMEAELNQTMQSIQNRYTQKPTRSTSDVAGTSGLGPENKCYAHEYFDSSSDEEMTSADKAKKEHTVISNDDLLYDPNMDDDDQRWVDSHRSSYQPTGTMPTSGASRKRKSHNMSKLPNSDAVLNCPACMTLLCRDCQRHSKYTHQYRAMFVTNCSVDKSETLKYPTKEQNKSKKQPKKQKKSTKNDSQTICSPTDNCDKSEPSVGRSSGDTTVEGDAVGMGTANVNNECHFEAYNPVKCTECTTTVGVIDEDELVHFFNVLASH